MTLELRTQQAARMMQELAAFNDRNAGVAGCVTVEGFGWTYVVVVLDRHTGKTAGAQHGWGMPSQHRQEALCMAVNR